MEIDFFIRCEFENTKKRNRISELIDGDTRPILDDDVEEDYRDSFNIIDDFPEPDEINQKGDNSIDLAMSLGGYDFEDEMQLVISGLKKIGAIRITSIIWDGEELTSFIQYANGETGCVQQYSQQAFETASESEDFSSIFELFDSIPH